MRLGFNPSKQEKIWLVVVMTAGLINGLLHTFIVPPWQHYDEPGNFEYAWLIANRPGLPDEGEYDQSMRREVAASMIEHEFFVDKNFRPNLLSITEPVWIGISQVDDVPLYYLLVSIPLSIFKYSDVTFQLYLGRLVSVGLFLIAIFGAYAITAEITSPGNSLRILIPATLALIPAYADIMSAVNNDAGAAAFFTLFLWVCVRILKRKITWMNSILMLLLAILCLFIKITTIFVIPLAIVALILALLPENKRNIGWVFFFLMLIVTAMIAIAFDGIADWHERSVNLQMDRSTTELTPLGEISLEMVTPRKTSSFTVIQLIPYSQSIDLKGKSVTVGAWMWADSPLQARMPVIDDGSDRYFETVNLGTMPAFYAYSMEVADRPGPLMIRLQTNRQLVEDRVSVYFDGIILVEGDYSQQGVPTFDDVNAVQGEWGNEHFTNFVRNASFERAALQIRSDIDTLLASYLPMRLSNVIGSWFDPEGFRSYYSITMQYMFRTFWAVFGWGDVYLIGSKPYRILLIISGISMIGNVIYIWKKRRNLPIHTLGFLGFALVGVWGMATIRGVNSVFTDPFIPAARYAYPVIVPTVLLFVVGWREILNIIGERFNIPKTLQYALFTVFLLILNVISFYSIWLFYHPA